MLQNKKSELFCILKMAVNPLLLKLNKRLYDLSEPVVMGILNVTPDSFFVGNRFTTDKLILRQAESILNEGAFIMDVGGYSTRPSAEPVSTDDEIRRLSEAIEIILKKFPSVILSVDTYRSSVVRHVVRNYGVAMINDVGGGTLDELMFETIAGLDVAYVLMHMRGTPQSMQSLTQYDEVVSEVLFFLEKRLAQLRLLGINDVIIDPGFGFAKTLEQNYKILQQLSYFKSLGTPILAGLSRKSMLYNLLETDAEHALNATTAANMLALMGGASILRVHDVKEAVETIRIFKQYQT